jgi:hypothetical protein
MLGISPTIAGLMLIAAAALKSIFPSPGNDLMVAWFGKLPGYLAIQVEFFWVSG